MNLSTGNFELSQPCIYYPTYTCRQKLMSRATQFIKYIILTEGKWNSLKSISEARRQSLDGLVDDLKSFQDSFDQLNTWLAQKDKMLAVLGPVATEPAMVNSQLQQVMVNTYSFFQYFQFHYHMEA